MKSDTVYLIHILECIAKIEDYTKSGKIGASFVKAGKK
ncbi:hypothetical protein ASZ90_017474 [hydrocarbon metagenome]|uniref:Uncharacterized protein n=1 Tax=hydrocarbon metagenome TaxID=938273 RepID=A0A0W8E9F5_9ZZZZ